MIQNNHYAVNEQVGISIFKILLQVTRPKTVGLGNIPGTDIFRNLHHYKEAMRIPGFFILSIEAPINFANTTYLKERFVCAFRSSSSILALPIVTLIILL